MSPTQALATQKAFASPPSSLNDAMLPFFSLLTWLTGLVPQPSADPVLLGVWRPGAHRQEASPVQELPEAGL